MITARQIRAARSLLGWTQEELSQKVGVSVPTIKRIEKNGLESIKAGSAEVLENAFTSAGIEFIQDDTREGAAVLLAPSKGKAGKKGSRP